MSAADVSAAQDEGAAAGLGSIENVAASAAAATQELLNEVKPKVEPKTRSKAAADEQISLSHDAKNHPYFYYQKSPSGSTTSQFLLHPLSAQHQNRSLYDNYGTTLLLIIALHIIYVYQWNKRYSKKDLCTNYEQLVEKKQYYRGVVAILSHPPVDGGERGGSSNNITVVGSNDTDASSTSSSNNASGSAATATTGISRFVPCLTFIQRFLHSARRIKQQYLDRFLQPLTSGSLSGLPLLVFCSHILWQCRALEELYVDYGGTLVGHVIDDTNGVDFSGSVAIQMKSVKDASSSIVEHHEPDNHAYFRVLVTLALTALLLELKYLRNVLRKFDRALDYDNSTNSPRNILRRRSMGSLCSLSAALLTVHDSHFPFVQIPVLPFLRVSFLTNSGFNKTVMIMMLFVLCHRVHPVTSVISGVVSGVLWSLQITSCLGTKYWGDMMLWSVGIAIVLSLKSNYTWLSAVIPCLDYVAWNREGEVVNTSISNATNQSGRSTPLDLEMGNAEHVPLMSQSSTVSGSSTIRGRLPRIDTMASDRS